MVGLPGGRPGSVYLSDLRISFYSEGRPGGLRLNPFSPDGSSPGRECSMETGDGRNPDRRFLLSTLPPGLLRAWPDEIQTSSRPFQMEHFSLEVVLLRRIV